MKKLAILPILALALGFAACDNVDLGTGIPVTNPQLPAAGVDQVTLTASPATSAVVNLAELDYDGHFVQVADLTRNEGWPAGYGFAANGFLSATEDFAVSYEIPVTVMSDSILELNPNDIQGIIHDNITKDPGEQTVYVRFNIYAAKGAEKILLGGPDTFFGPVKMTVKPFDPEVTFENLYYFVYTSDPVSWNKDNAVAFTRSDRSVYDDPDFSVTLNLDGATVGDGLYWKILPASGYDADNFENAIGVEAASASATKGKLDKAANAVPGFFTMTGPVLFKFNIETLEYDYIQAIPNFWMAGDYVNGTSWNNGQFALVMWTDNYTDYVGMAHIGSQFKFSPQAGWGGDFGVNAQPSWSEQASGLVGEGAANGGNNIEVPEDGLYYIQLNYGTRALKLTLVTTIGMIGDFNGWGDDVNMTPSEDLLTWTATVDLTEGGLKFRFNDNWDNSLGGSFDKLSPFADNIAVSEAGTYEVTLHLDNIPYTATLVKK